MDYFEPVFVLSMILFPAVLTLFVSRKAVPGEHSRGAQGQSTSVAARQRRLWFWTAVAVLVYLGLHWSAGRSVSHWAWMFCFPLWFGLALPVLQAKDPGWRGLPRTSVRTATLQRRDVLPAGLVRAWLLLGVVWLLLFAAALAGIWMDAPGARLWWVLVFPLTSAGQCLLFYWAQRRSLVEPEPAVEDDAAEVAEAREALRNLKLHAWFGAAAICVAAFSLPALVLIWFGQAALNWAIGLGVGGGVLGGIFGGVFGAMADLRRARLNRLCLEQSAQPLD